jgi:hypothetical protein
VNINLKNIITVGALIFLAIGIYSAIPETAGGDSVQIDTTLWAERLSNLLNLATENWKWTLAIVIALILLIKAILPSKPKVNAFVSGGVGGFIETTSIVLFLLIVVAVVSLIGLGITDAFTDGKVQQQVGNVVAIARGEPLPERAHNGDECDFKDKLEAHNNRIPTEWFTITICKDDSKFLFFVPKGTVPEIDYRDRSDRVLDSRPIADFVRIDATYGKPGGMPDLYMLYIPQGQGSSLNGFQSASLDSVTFDIRARRN